MNGSDDQPPAAEREQTSGNNAGIPPRQPSAAESQFGDTVPAQPATRQQLEQTEHAIEKRMTAFERSMIRLTRAGVIVGVITLLIFGGQLYEMYDSGRETNKLVGYAQTQSQDAEKISAAADAFKDSAAGVNQNSKAAAKSMSTSASAAGSAAQTAKDTLEKSGDQFSTEERPYLVPAPDKMDFYTTKDKDGNLINPIVVGTTPMINSSFINVGKTPALDAQVVVNAAILLNHTGQIDAPSLVPYADYIIQDIKKGMDSPNNLVFKTDLAPGGLMFTSHPVPRQLTQEDVDGLPTGKAIIFFEAVMTYHDSDNRQYSGESCWFWFGKFGDSAWHYCSGHNIIR